MTGLILCGVFIAVGAPMILLARSVRAKDARIAAWPRVPGKVLGVAITSDTRTVREKSGASYQRTTYRPTIRYAYSVGGKAFEGTRIHRQDDANVDRPAAEREIAPYPAGTDVSVLYDPEAPATSFLETRRSLGATILFVFGGFWVLLGVTLLVLVR